MNNVFFTNVARDWLTRFDEVERLLPTLIHLTGGMPGRATELETFRLRGSGSVGRHVFLSHDCIYIAPSYTKTQSLQDNDIGQYRFLPKWVSLILLRLFFVFRPFAHWLASSIIGDYDNAFRDRLFVSRGHAMTAQKIRNFVTSQLNHRKLPLSFGELRHVMKYLFNEGLAEMAKKGGTL